MIYRTITTLLAILLMYGCSEQQPAKTHKQVVKEEGFDADSTCGYYKLYKGTVAGQPVVLHYMAYGTTIRGEYYYLRTGQIISLYNYTDTIPTDLIYLSENPTTEHEDNSANWEVLVSGDSISGKWISGDGADTYPIQLKEDFSGGAQHFSIVCFDDSCKLKDNLPEPHAYISHQLLLPVGNDEATAFIRSVIYRNLLCDTTGASMLKQCLHKKNEQYFAGYRQDNNIADTMIMEAPNFYNWTQMTNFWVSYNEDGMVVLNQHHYEYTGGAHGNYGSRYMCIDAANRKLLTLNDIITVDEPRLVSLLDAAVRKLFTIEDGAPLNTALLAESIHVPEEFYITGRGITFVYATYEIAPYAAGEVNLFVPYEKLSDMLTPYFKQRMRLSSLTAKK